MPAFYIFLAMAIAVVTLSVIFIDWKSIVWSKTIIWFSFLSTVLWLIILRFFFYWGAGVFIAGSVFIILVNSFLSGWQSVDENARFLKLRLLTHTSDEYIYELTDPENNVFFISSSGSRANVIFYLLKFDQWIFFVQGRNFFSLNSRNGTDDLTDTPGFKILMWVSSKINAVSLERIIFPVPELQILKQYELKLRNDRIYLNIISVDI